MWLPQAGICLYFLGKPSPFSGDLKKRGQLCSISLKLLEGRKEARSYKEDTYLVHSRSKIRHFILPEVAEELSMEKHNHCQSV